MWVIQRNMDGAFYISPMYWTHQLPLAKRFRSAWSANECLETYLGKSDSKVRKITPEEKEKYNMVRKRREQNAIQKAFVKKVRQFLGQHAKKIESKLVKDPENYVSLRVCYYIPMPEEGPFLDRMTDKPDSYWKEQGQGDGTIHTNIAIPSTFQDIGNWSLIMTDKELEHLKSRRTELASFFDWIGEQRIYLTWNGSVHKSTSKRWYPGRKPTIDDYTTYNLSFAFFIHIPPEGQEPIREETPLENNPEMVKRVKAMLNDVYYEIVYDALDSNKHRLPGEEPLTEEDIKRDMVPDYVYTYTKDKDALAWWKALDYEYQEIILQNY